MKPHAMLILVAGLLLAAAPRDDQSKDSKEEILKLQGTWKFISWETEGQDAPREAVEASVLIFDGEKYLQKIGDDIVERGTQKLDPTQSPKTVDYQITEGEEQGKTQLGIYKLEGDRLTICVARPGDKQRPKEFATKKGSGTTLVVLKREGDKV
jgi:uncharacterized protein (TIGR03067 family)